MDSSVHFPRRAASYLRAAAVETGGLWPALRALLLWLVTIGGAFGLIARAQTEGPPRLLSISGASTVDQGERVMLAVIFFDNPPTTPLRYQWARNAAPIAGATASSYVIAAATTADAGTYAITVSNDAGSSTLSGELTVRPPSAVQFSSVVVNPSRTPSAGSAVTFLVNAIGSFPRTYQWQKDGANITGATDLTLNLFPVTTAHNGTYVLIGRNSLGTSSTTPVVITVGPATPIVFAPNSPADAALVEGQGGQLSFTLSAGTHPMTYQWRKNGAVIPNAIEAALTLGPITSADAGRYSVTVTNAAGSATSREAIVTVVPATPIVISTHPAPQTIFVGQQAQFSVQYGAGTQPIRYQWRKDGVAIPGETSTVFAIARATEADAADYSVVLTNPAGAVTSNAARLTVQPATAPSIIRQSTDVTVPYFDQFVLSADVAGTPPLTYAWRRNDQLVSSNSSVSAHSVTQETHGGTYVLQVSNAAGTVTSTPIIVTVRPPVLPVIVRQPTPVTVNVGGEMQFSVQYSDVGVGEITLQWLKNGQPVGVPATNNPGSSAPRTETFFIRAVQPLDAGDYSARLTSRAGVVTSSAARLTVLDAPSSGRDYSGIYFGTVRSFSPTQGDVALYIRPDRSGVLLSQILNLPDASATFVLSADGSFRFEASQYPLSVSLKVIISGSVGSDGVISGSYEGQGTTFTATKVSGDSPLAGFYQATATGFAGGSMLAIVGGDGRIVALAENAQILVAAAGVLDDAGKIAVTNPNGHTLSISSVAAVGEVSAVATAPRGGSASFLGVRDGMVRSARLTNISTRGRAGVAEEAMIAGFVISGSAPRTLLVRAIGPALAEFGVNNALADARLTLFRGSTIMMESDDWGREPDATRIAAMASRVGAFPLPVSGRDAVLLATLEPGSYTAQVTSKTGVAGVSLVEVYEVGEGADAEASRLVNIATRGWVGTGDDALIAGIVISGNAPKTVLIRAIGPGLARLGVGGVLDDPALTVQQAGTTVAANDDWNRLDGTSDVAAVLAATAKVGAFALVNASQDAALLVRLYPGNYTAKVSGKGAATGLALIEVYEVDP